MTESLRVTHVLRAFQTGGLETLVLEMSARMRRRGLDARAVALLPGDGLERRPRYGGVPCEVLDESEALHVTRAVRTLRRVFREARPHVVHVHNWFSHVRSAPAAWLARVPVIVSTKHGMDMPRLLRSRRMARRAYCLADALVAVSADVRDALMATYGFPSGKVRLILNGIDTDRFRPGPARSLASRQSILGLDGSPMLGTVCRISKEKGIPELLAAFGTVSAQLPQASLAIVGDGPERSACEEESRRLGVADRVRFLGNRDNMPDVYPLFDIYVQPSHTEGISLTMLEASSCALPIVATAVGGNREIVVDGETGRLVPPGNVQAVAGALLALWANPDASRAMGQAARQRVVQRFSLDRMVDEYVDLYREILARKVGTSADAVGRTT
jgi:glycosyltransferase involved in cell wall biosynthesis